VDAARFGAKPNGQYITILPSTPSARGARVDAARFRVRHFGLYVFSLKRFTLTVFYLWLNSRYHHDNVNILFVLEWLK
jgi:hypothetical protein